MCCPERHDRDLPEYMPASKSSELTEEKIQPIAKALADSRRQNAMACEIVRESMDISAPTLSHYMKAVALTCYLPISDRQFF